MKKIILFIGIFLVFMSGSFAQLNETELTPILQDAKDFAEKSNQEGFEYSIEQFAAWLEVKTLKPQSLNQTNRTLLISALKSAFSNDIIKDSNKHLTLFFEFLKYESENNDDEENWHRLGYLYNMGFGIAQNYTIAKYWYEKAIEKGFASAMNNLGSMYQNGHGVTQNYITAKYWYEKAAEKGNAAAMNQLGFMYYGGLGVTQNYTTAKYWYEKAAEKGESSAMYNLGFLYDEGHGVAQNYTTAKYWYEKACNLGYQPACDNYKKIE
jgi:TPR repeat protein